MNCEPSSKAVQSNSSASLMYLNIGYKQYTYYIYIYVQPVKGTAGLAWLGITIC